MQLIKNADFRNIPGAPYPCLHDILQASPSCTELLDESIALYYLHNLPECRVNIAKGLAMLYELEESEEQIYRAVTLRSRSCISIETENRSSPDQGFFKLQEEYENEKRAVQKERALLQNYLKNENHKLVILEGCIFALPEPQRSVIVSRYIDRLSWTGIQQKMKRSASRIYSLNKEGISGILLAVKELHGFSDSPVPVREKIL